MPLNRFPAGDGYTCSITSEGERNRYFVSLVQGGPEALNSKQRKGHTRFVSARAAPTPATFFFGDPDALDLP